MNTGQIMMSMMQGITTSVPEAAMSAGGAQMPGEGGFSDLLVALQTEAQLFQRLPETGSEPILSEPEPVLLQSEGVADLTRNCPEVSNAGAQMILAAYAQPARMPGVTDQPDHDVDMLQKVAETRQNAQPSVTLAAVAAKMGLKQFDEPAPAQFNIPEATASSPATSLQQDGRMPIVNTPPSQEVDAVQNVPPAPPVQQAEQTPVTVTAAPKLQSFEPVHVQTVHQAIAVAEQQPARPVTSVPFEMSTKSVEAAVQRQPSTPPQHDGGMPVIDTPPSQKVDAAQNVHPAPAAQQAEQKSVVATVVSKAQVFEPAQPVRQAAAVSEQQPAKPVASAPVEVYPKTVEAAVQRQPSTPSQQDGRTPVIDTPPSQKVDTVQNVPPAPPVQQAEQTPVIVTTAPKSQAFEPVHVQTVRQAAAVQRQPSPPPHQESRTPVVNTPPRQDVDVVQNVAATSAPKQTLEEITFSLARPISVSRNQPLEQNRTQQTAFVDRPNIISLDLDQIQSRPADIQSAHELLPEGIASVRRQNTGSTAPVANATNLEPLSARKEQPLAGMPVMPTETLLVKSEMDVLEKGKVDIRTASLQRSLHDVPDQIAVGTRLESEKQSSMPKLTKEEDLLLQQSAKPVAETSLTSDDSMGGSADQTGTGQNPDNQMLAHQLHGQSKTEHHNVAALSSNASKPEPSGQELPERVAHQVRDRLNQHEVKQGSQQITLTLSPENLGELKMNLNLQGQRLSVEILTENRLVRDAILQHSDSLKESLARQNIAVESFDVTANGRGSGNSGHNQDAWKELARQKQQHFWGSNGVYHPAQVESQTNPLAYRATNEQAMLDIHY